MLLSERSPSVVTQSTLQPSAVWQRRTNKVIATAVIIIGLTMMISTIPQCIYIGLIFIVMALIWLAYMRMLENKEEPPRPDGQQPTSPVLFLVTSQRNLQQNRRIPTQADPNDVPPTYDQIVKLDGLPPDYIAALSEKPPRYEDLGSFYAGVHVSGCESSLPQPQISADIASPDAILFTECNIDTTPVSTEASIHYTNEQKEQQIRRGDELNFNKSSQDQGMLNLAHSSSDLAPDYSTVGASNSQG